MSKKTEIPFGTFDSELQEQEICIPDGFGASIENGKIILRKIENKDEKIRKAIVEFFELQDDNTTYSFIPKKDILAWLEKQCSDISSFPENQRKYMEKYTSLNKVTLIKLLAERDMNVEECINSFEKQGEQKPFDYENCNIQQHDFVPKSTMKAIEENVDEANFADNKKADVVKPIFKVGDEVYNRFDKSLAHVIIEYVDESTYYGDTTNFDIIDQDQWGFVRSCENCKCGHYFCKKSKKYDYPAVSCYLHEDCGGNEPIIILDDDFVETAMNCKEFEQEN